ncbi:hypothetical protein D9M71_371860 [compost metagenome]
MQGGYGQAAGAGAHQVDFLAAGDGAAGVQGFFQCLHVSRQAPFAVARIGIAPAHHEHLQAVLQGVLDEALLRREIEDVVLVDLRRHHQQRTQVLLLAHGLVLDQLQQLVAQDHGAGSGGEGAADLEGVLADLAGHAVVVQQVVQQVAQALDQAEPASVEQLLHRQGVEQAVGGRQCVAQLGQDETGAGAVVVAEVAFLDPGAELPLPGEVDLQAAAIEGVVLPGGVGEAAVLRVGLVQGVAEQHPADLAAEGERVACAVHRVPQSVQRQVAYGGKQILAAQSDYGVLCVHEGGGCRQGARDLFFSHGGNAPISVRGSGGLQQGLYHQEPEVHSRLSRAEFKLMTVCTGLVRTPGLRPTRER